MILINLCGAPGCGKSTMAAYLYYKLKKAGVRAELVGEAARELIYASTPGVVPPPLLDNQFLVAGLQYERILRLQRHGVEVAISDSPLIQGLMYCEQDPLHDDLSKLVEHAQYPCRMWNILIRGIPGNFDAESRVQKTEVEAQIYNQKAADLQNYFRVVEWDQEELLHEIVMHLWRRFKDAFAVRRTLRLRHDREAIPGWTDDCTGSHGHEGGHRDTPSERTSHPRTRTVDPQGGFEFVPRERQQGEEIMLPEMQVNAPVVVTFYPTARAAVLAFVLYRSGKVEGVNQAFTAAQLRDYVNRNVDGGVSPSTADRVLRDLRKNNELDYVVLNRGKSLYRAVPLPTDATVQS